MKRPLLAALVLAAAAVLLLAQAPTEPPAKPNPFAANDQKLAQLEAAIAKCDPGKEASKLKSLQTQLKAEQEKKEKKLQQMLKPFDDKLDKAKKALEAAKKQNKPVDKFEQEIAKLNAQIAEIEKLAPSPFPLINSKAVKERFEEITAEDMEMLRGKKILLGSRSFGLNTCGGLARLAAADKKYDLISTFKRYDVFSSGGDVSVVPANAFEISNFVHVMVTYWPHEARLAEVDKMLRNPPHEFAKKVDAVVIFYHTATPALFPFYTKHLDAWRKDFPNIRFIAVTSGFMGPKLAKNNEESHGFGELVRERYQGKMPIYDMAAILSDDFRAQHFYCPEYSKDPLDVHPDTELGEAMLAKGLLLVLRDAFRQRGAPPPVDDQPAPQVANAEKLPPDHPDMQAVRAILDANGLKAKAPEGVAVVKNGRVAELYLQECGLVEITDQIGALAELRVLHAYGDRKLAHPLLRKVSPAIAKCAKLEELLLGHNDLATLPAEIATLANLKNLALGDNRLANLPPAVLEWAKRLDPKGLEQQSPDAAAGK